jgi:hypothetical protein
MFFAMIFIIHKLCLKYVGKSSYLGGLQVSSLEMKSVPVSMVSCSVYAYTVNTVSQIRSSTGISINRSFYISIPPVKQVHAILAIYNMDFFLHIVSRITSNIYGRQMFFLVTLWSSSVYFMACLLSYSK